MLFAACVVDNSVEVLVFWPSIIVHCGICAKSLYKEISALLIISLCFNRTPLFWSQILCLKDMNQRTYSHTETFNFILAWLVFYMGKCTQEKITIMLIQFHNCHQEIKHWVISSSRTVFMNETQGGLDPCRGI